MFVLVFLLLFCTGLKEMAFFSGSAEFRNVSTISSFSYQKLPLILVLVSFFLSFHLQEEVTRDSEAKPGPTNLDLRKPEEGTNNCPKLCV